ncbi:MAG: tRNA lysidine(34) synthetase TilS [Bacteroidales bacterium]|nr:tRNA lysidine(34) synthetase TilS [Bacteroidales bacterium]
MQKAFSRKVNELKEITDGGFLLAVSGGIDSMCMADLFLKTGESFAVAHCNFHLRGEESDEDAALVRAWTEEHSVRFHLRNFDTAGYAEKQGISIEMAARDLRYSWFSDLCEEFGYKVVIVAHNADDNAETLMLNLLRGCGLKGASAIAPLSVLPDGRSGDVKLFRPLLDVTRKQIEGYVFANGIAYRTDRTNFESDYKRNRIRNEVFPHFAKINPSFVRTLNRDIDYFTDAAQIVESWCEKAAAEVTEHSSEHGSIYIDIKKLMEYKQWKYLLYYILQPYGFTSLVLSSLENLLVSERTISGKRFESSAYVLMTGRNGLFVEPIDSVSHKELTENDAMVTVRAPGRYSFCGTTFMVEILPYSKDMSLKQPSGTVIMDAGRMRFPFVCRKWRQGDWLVPFGMKGKKKVSDLFADLKYDLHSKKVSIIMVDTRTDGLAEVQHVAGVLGVRIDDAYKVTESTERILRLSVITSE